MDKCNHFFYMALTNSCYVFTITLLGNLLLGSAEMTRPTLWSLLLISAACGVLQTLCFSFLFFKKLSYGLRVLIFAVTMFAILSAIAVGFGWFPADRLDAWAWFVIWFLACPLAIFFVFELCFRCKGNRYKEQLDKYRAQKADSNIRDKKE